MKKALLVVLLMVLCCGCVDETPAFPIEQDNCFMYARQQLSEELKEDYDTLYEAIMEMKTVVDIKATDVKDIASIYTAIERDHPEIFWMRSETSETLNLELLGIFTNVYLRYEYSNEEVQTFLQQIEEKKKEILNGIDINASDYDKTKYVYDYIIDNTKYKSFSKDNQNILSVLLYGDSVCAGYAKTMQYLLTELGVKSHLLIGVVNESQGTHAWNMVMMDGEYYYIDATYGDPVSEDGEDLKTYAYFALTSSEMENVYTADSTYEDSAAITDNYFMKQGAYLETMDTQQISNLFLEALNSNQIVSVKCKDADTYALYKASLIDEGNAYNYLRNLGYYVDSMTYSEYENVNVINIMF